MYVIAVFLGRMDDGGGHDYASDDIHVTSNSLFKAILGALVYLQMLAKGDD